MKQKIGKFLYGAGIFSCVVLVLPLLLSAGLFFLSAVSGGAWIFGGLVMALAGATAFWLVMKQIRKGKEKPAPSWKNCVFTLFCAMDTVLLFELGSMILFMESRILSIFWGIFLLAFLLCLFWQSRRRLTLQLMGVTFLVFWGVMAGEKAYEAYDRSITITQSHVRLEEYQPFAAESKIATLPHEASVHFTENLPVLDGATALFPVYSAFVHAVYPSDIPEVNETGSPIVYNNTVGGYEKLARRETDVFFGAYPSEGQLAAARAQGTEFVFTEIGREGFVFFVHKDNPVESLTADQIRGIYAGTITNWSQVGGKNRPILAYQRNSGSGSQSQFLRFMGDTTLMDPPTEQVVDAMSGIIDEVADYRNRENSIGFSFRYYAEEMIQNHDVKLLAVDGVAPTIENITDNSYPLTDPFYAVTWKGNDNPSLEPLIQWILSEEGQTLIRETGYAPIR